MTVYAQYELPCFGIKGPAAADWLVAQGMTVPPQPNQWLSDGRGRILRLGRGEYLIEGEWAQHLQQTQLDGQQGLYRVPRYDAAFRLEGEAIPAMLREICALDLRPEQIVDRVVMTIAAHVNVILTCEHGSHTHSYRLWCDATYGDYMRHVLEEILG